MPDLFAVRDSVVEIRDVEGPVERFGRCLGGVGIRGDFGQAVVVGADEHDLGAGARLEALVLQRDRVRRVGTPSEHGGGQQGDRERDVSGE